MEPGHYSTSGLSRAKEMSPHERDPNVEQCVEKLRIASQYLIEMTNCFVESTLLTENVTKVIVRDKIVRSYGEGMLPERFAIAPESYLIPGARTQHRHNESCCDRQQPLTQ